MNIGAIIDYGYLAMGVISAWILWGTFAWEERYPKDTLPEGDDIAFAAFFAVFAALIWPLSLPVALVIGRDGKRSYLYCPPKHRDAKNRIIRQRYEQRIRQLEIEAGIR